MIVARGVRTALSAEDEYGAYIAFGISVLFGVQALINLAVAMSVLPTKGLTLPFVSFGGSSLLVCAAAMGILLSISRKSGSKNARVAFIGGRLGPNPEASAMLVTEANFAPEASPSGRGRGPEKRKPRLPVVPKEGAVSATLVLAGGGTGGHVYPMIAVADALRELAPEIRLVFVGTERGMESRVVPERGYELELMRVLPIRGGGVLGALRGIARAAASLPEARALLKKLAPRAVFSIGGYAAGPISLGARSLRVPVALMEPNSVIGLANRLIAPLVQRAYTAFPESERHFKPSLVLRAGVPIRKGFEPVPFMPRLYAPRVLVLGGSQGAKSLNEAVPRALAHVRCQLQRRAPMRRRA